MYRHANDIFAYKETACLVLSVSSSSWYLGRAAICDCGTPWTFLLSFFLNIKTESPIFVCCAFFICKETFQIFSYGQKNDVHKL